MANDDKQSTELEVNFFNSLHLMKVVACVSVIIIHACIFNIDKANRDWWALNVFNAATRFAVPMFIMISGALLINQNHSLITFLKKRAIRIIPPLIFWSICYLAWLDDGRLTSIIGLKAIIAGPVYYHLWYLYSMIGVLLFSPILTVFYLKSTNDIRKYFLILWALTYSIYPVIRQIFDLQFDIVNVYELQSFTGLIGWYFLGAYVRDCILERRLNLNHSVCFLLFSTSTLVIIVLTYLYSSALTPADKSTFTTSPLFFERNSPLIVISTTSLFIFLSTLKINHYSKSFEAIKTIASFSLGIYCLHLMILRELLAPISNLFQSRWVSVPTLSITVFLVCIAIIYPIRKIKITKYVL